MTSTTTTVGTPRQVAIKDLRLDPENPRLPEGFRGGPQLELAGVLVMGFDAFAVAQSIADNGYFAGEPLLAIPSTDENGTWIVIEGNRRLTALKGLSDPTVRSQFDTPDRWNEVAARAGISADALIPIVEHPDRPSTHVEVARAHVVGKLQWPPFMQARFIADRVAEGRTIAEVADMIGIPKSKAADLYRDQAVVKQAQAMGMSTGEVEKAFSVLTVAMGNTKLRAHVGAPLGSQLKAGTEPIPAEKKEELGELLAWIFGTPDAEPKITDSRQMSVLGNVVDSEVGLKALREDLSLDEAKQKVNSSGLQPKDRLTQRLTAAKNALLAATDDIAEFATDAQITVLMNDLEAAFESLRSTIIEVQIEDDGFSESEAEPA